MIGTKVAALALAAGGVGILGLGAWQVHATGVQGHDRHEMFHKFVGFAVNEKLDAIGATAAQKEKVRAVEERLFKKGESLHGERASFHHELMALLEQDSPDPAQVKALAHKHIDKFSQFADDAADALVELHGVFTPEQRQQLLGELREHMERHHHN
ncbi:MAG TPA: periplasmic heavy metal sensor [Vicinamibacteria bacterium]|nr:periplasmic heavy metal sensor [Vicinamibacteria bacterium]